jgi:hypothetical protein
VLTRDALSRCESKTCPSELITPPDDCHVNRSLSFTLQVRIIYSEIPYSSLLKDVINFIASHVFPHIMNKFTMMLPIATFPQHLVLEVYLYCCIRANHTLPPKASPPIYVTPYASNTIINPWRQSL